MLTVPGLRFRWPSVSGTSGTDAAASATAWSAATSTGGGGGGIDSSTTSPSIERPPWPSVST